MMDADNAKTRLFVDLPLAANSQLSLSDARRHYLVNVMRLGTGASLALFNGEDGEWAGRITEVGKKQCTITVESQLKPQINCLDLWLLFVPVKKARLDFIAQKASELGVSCIWPVRTDYLSLIHI